MKRTLRSLITLLLILALALNIFGCGKTKEKPAETTTAAESATAASETTTAGDENDPWASAICTEDREFGEGAVTVEVEVQVNDNHVTFTVHTDKDTLGEALLEHSLIAGEDGQYGLYIKEVNGIPADYDTDQAYWGFYKDGEYMMTGVDATEIADGEHYELVYTKG